MSASNATNKMTTRVGWMDAARGAAIILVIYGHAVGVPFEQGWNSPEVLEWVRGFFRPFRMPLLLFLSGLLVARAVQKSPKRYLFGKWEAILWPFILWNLIRWATRPERPPIWDLELWLEPGYLWYLIYIAAYYVLALPLRGLPAWVPAAGFVAAWVVIGDDSAASRFVQCGVFFFAGYAVTRANGRTFVPTRAAWLLGPMASVAVVTGVLCAAGEIPERHILMIPAIFCGILVVIRFCEIVTARGRVAWLEWVGRNSLIFYVSHFPIMSASTRILGDSGIVPGAWLWVPNLIAGAAGALMFVFMQRFWWARWPYRAPRLRRAERRDAAPSSVAHSGHDDERVSPRSLGNSGGH